MAKNVSPTTFRFVLQLDSDFIYISNNASRRNVTEATIDSTVLAGKTISPLISDAVARILEIILPIFLFILTSLFGIVVNIINIIVYKRHGLHESIILGFFALSVSDLILVACPLGAAFCIAAEFLYPEAPVYFKAVHFVSSGNLREMAYFYSNGLTAFLSIERCCCVILPFKVKAIFTRDRSLVFIISLLLFIILGYAPVVASAELRWMENPSLNGSQILNIWFAPFREVTYSYSLYLIGIATPTASLLIVICNTSIMTYGLRASSKFRKATTGNTNNSKNDSESTLSSRDTRLVKIMIFLGTILTVCNLPYVLFVFSRYFEPELNFGKAYFKLYLVLYNSCYLLSSMNASVNIFVYHKNSSRYRQIFDESFRCLSGKK